MALSIFAAGPVAPRTVTRYSLTSANDFPGRDPKDWRLLGSNDGGKTWSTLDVRTNQFFNERFETREFSVSATNQQAFTTFRFVIDSIRDWATSVQLAHLRLTGRVGGGEPIDITPRAGDLVTAQGENSPVETRWRLFDSDPKTKWLDYAVEHPATRSSWVQWEYEAADASGADFVQLLSTVREVQEKARAAAFYSYRIALNGEVVWASAQRKMIVLQDDSGGVLLALDPAKYGLQAGQKISLRTDALVRRRGASIAFAQSPVANNDGVHEMRESSGSILLESGRHPIRLGWFNAEGRRGLNVEYAGPGIARQPIPNSALFHLVVETGGATNWVAGLHYRYYEGGWDTVPDFASLQFFREGAISNFELSAASQPEEVGILFTGYIEVLRSGLYTFYTASDDGSLLYLGEQQLEIKVLGSGVASSPRRVIPGRVLANAEERRWVMVDGKVAFAGKGENGLELELISDTGRMNVLVSGAEPLPYLLNSRIRATGICQPAYRGDRIRVAGGLIVPSMEEIKVTEFPAATFTEYGLQRIQRVANLATNITANSRPVRVHGRLSVVAGALSIEDGTGKLLLEPMQTDLEATEGRFEV
ncbi:MAG TPA: hypothetical protein VGR78_08745, partial [Verrucomicrobiae bacterium]|nr:hypothetical protein [Verrucomicrobiae bacterium]